MKGNLRSLDALRGLLALYVLIGHARWLLWEGWHPWQSSPHSPGMNCLVQALAVFRYGHEAVFVFFALSGYFIHLQAAQRLVAGEPFHLNKKLFFRRRFQRLVPPYGFALLLTVVLDLLGRSVYPPLYLGRTGDALLDTNFSASGYSLASVLPAMVLLPRSLNHTFGSNGPLWSLAYEIVYYAAYPFWLKLRNRSFWLAYLMVPAGLALACAPVRAGFLLDVATGYPTWLLGAGVAEYFSCQRNSAWVSLGALVGATALVVPGMDYPGRAFCDAVGGVACVLLFANLPATLSCWLGDRGLGVFGIRSYSIYVLHFPMVTLLSALTFARWGERPENPLFCVMGAVLVIGLCCVCFKWVEQPFLHRPRQN